MAHTSGLFEGSDGQMVFTHNLKLLEENKYWLAGRLIGMSLMQDGPGFGCLNPTVYRLICGLPCDVYEFDEGLLADKDFVNTVQQVQKIKKKYNNFVKHTITKPDHQAQSKIPCGFRYCS